MTSRRDDITSILGLNIFMEQITAYFHNFHSQIFDPERLPVAVAALLLVSVVGAALGAMGGNANPLLWRNVDFLFGNLGNKLDKVERTKSDLASRGMIIAFTVIFLTFLLGQAFATLSIEYPNYKMVDIVALSIVMSAGAGWHALARLYKALHDKGLIKGAFYTIAKTSRNNLVSSDEFTITRVGIGMGARLFDKGVVGPVLWYLIAGLPAAYIYAGLAALAWRFGKEGFTKGFGAVPLALEKLLGFVPNLFAGLLISLAGLLTPTAGMTRSLIGLFPGHSGRADYEQGGAVVTAMAYALKVSLGGPTQDLDGSAIQRGWSGPQGATAKLDAKHLHRGIYILVMAHLLLLASLLAGIVIEGRGFFG
jgi:adenosylcobinamide-phosphate synthase